MSAPHPCKDMHLAHKPCICRNLHQLCDPNSCKEACKSKVKLSGLSMPASAESARSEWAVTTTMEGLRRAARRECLTCGILFHGILKWGGSYEVAGFKDMTVKVKDRSGHVVLSYDNTEDGIFAADDYIDFYAKTGSSYNKLCQAFPEVHELSKHTASSLSFENLATWIKDCEQHESCSYYAATLLPKRVICNRHMYLYESQGEEAKYIALSHCWGKKLFIKTTISTLKNRKKQIHWRSLSKTFQDAVTITRRLGIEYLWIDSLCIIQDDKADWVTESAKMGSIFQNSYLTIAASHASDGEHGCFIRTPELADLSFEVAEIDCLKQPSGVFCRRQLPHHEFEMTPNGTGADRMPLSRRAWVLQERMLSKRIVHFTASELVWECRTIVSCQCRRVSLQNPENQKLRYFQCLSKNLHEHEIFPVWTNLIETYTSRNITYDTDRLTALSGLAEQFQAAGAGMYLAGIWRRALPQLMTWISSAWIPRRPNSYVAPSWSWASVVGSVYFIPNTANRRRTMPRIIDARWITSLRAPLSAGTGGHVTIYGQVIEATLSVDISLVDVKPLNRKVYYPYILKNEENKSTCEFRPDAKSEMAALGQTSRVSCILWSVYPDQSRNSNPYEEVDEMAQATYLMVLVPSTQFPSLYERLGMGWLNWSFDDPLATPIQHEVDYGDLTKSTAPLPLAKAWFKNARRKVFTIV